MGSFAGELAEKAEERSWIRGGCGGFHFFRPFPLSRGVDGIVNFSVRAFNIGIVWVATSSGVSLRDQRRSLRQLHEALARAGPAAAAADPDGAANGRAAA